MPVRKIPKSYQNVTGIISSERNGSLVGFESPLERDLYLILDFDINVSRFEEQPVKISYVGSNGENRTYTPDVLVHYRDDIIPAKGMPPMLCEVKPREKLRKNWAKYKPRFKAAMRYARARGWRFRILTEREIRTPHLQNVKFLGRFRHMHPPKDHKKLILDAMYELREADPEGLLMSITYDKWRRAEIMPTLWHLIAISRIGADLNLPLTMQSRIWTMEPVRGGIVP